MATRKNSICDKSYDLDSRTASFIFAEGAGEITVTLEQVKPVLTNLALHGLVQKVGDCYAGEKDAKEAFAKAQDMVKRLAAGDWTKARESKGPSSSIIVEAITRLRQEQKPETTIDEIQDRWNGMDEDTRKKLRDDSRIKAAVAAIKAERAAAKVAKESNEEQENALELFDAA